jgi:hypothetical protein
MCIIVPIINTWRILLSLQDYKRMTEAGQSKLKSIYQAKIDALSTDVEKAKAEFSDRLTVFSELTEAFQKDQDYLIKEERKKADEEVCASSLDAKENTEQY